MELFKGLSEERSLELYVLLGKHADTYEKDFIETYRNLGQKNVDQIQKKLRMNLALTEVRSQNRKQFANSNDDIYKQRMNKIEVLKLRANQRPT